jgi:hypothetical protein
MLGTVNAHIAGHLTVSIGAILLFIAAFSKHYRRAPLHVRLLLLIIGPVGVAWSVLGMYLISHTTAQDHITLSRAQFWILSHIQSDLGGFGVGLLVALAINPEFYRRRHRSIPASNQSLEPTADRRDAQI